MKNDIQPGNGKADASVVTNNYRNGGTENKQRKNGVASKPAMETATTKTKKIRRNKADLGPNFVAPDGGWGWLVVIAAGTSNVRIFGL